MPMEMVLVLKIKNIDAEIKECHFFTLKIGLDMVAYNKQNDFYRIN